MNDRAEHEDAVRARLSALLAEFWFDVDHNGGSGAAGYFTPDARLRFEEASFRGTAQIAEVYRARAARGPRVSRHLVTNVHVLESESGRARTVSALLLFAEDGHAPRPRILPALVADVWDEFEFIEGRWLINARWIRNQFLESSDDLAVPVK
ncbi:nuclear transport factor 2 family protein [Microbacterium rhizomatis]|uniref:SnoaL-like domain-containing protein n=1 Tax=Microbacterium rhizomatis TaxID=1631477 RepID=A0A5J5J219_9MICO|nr:nuclear transport factor 2 family protein [Microbacterium rhizomatis]KAA9107729.1 hypothetical protein F6B43_09790 [Microbacterium rhizomatis]